MNFLTESTAPPAFSSRSLECKRIFFSPPLHLCAPLDPLEKLSRMASQHTSTVPPQPSRSHCERSSKIRKLPLPNGYVLVYFRGAPGKVYLNVDFRSLCSTCFTQVEWKRVVLLGSRMTDCALPVLSALCHSCPCVRKQCLALHVSK